MQGGDEGISPPPGLSPPGRVASSSGEASGPAVERLAANMMAQAQVEEGGRDVPDLSLKSPGLQDPESEIKVATSQGSVYTSASTFEELGLSKQLLDGLYQEMKFERPSRIQATTLPMILTAPYKSMIAQAHNGSGKTTCFVLAMLTRVDPEQSVPQAVCICPTRELVNQNAAVVRQMGKYCTNIECVTTAEQSSGGAAGGYRREKVTAQIVVGTHGTLKTWVSKRMLELRDVRVIVFDEADEMLSGHGFGADSVRLVNDVRRAAGPDVQILLFSATFDEQVKSFAQRVASGSNHVFVPKEKLSLDVIKQYRVQCPTESAKHRVLKDVIFPNCTKLGQTIIFVRRRETAPRLKDMMVREGFTVTSIAGDMEHADRDRVVNEFREGTTRILISTDVLSRGFNVNQVTLVINYDLPVNRDGYPAYETYLHRIGRSGRFGRKGAAFNLVASREDAQIMDDISNYFRHPVPEILLDNEQDFITVLKEADLMGKDD